jgi:hypothetical protein
MPPRGLRHKLSRDQVIDLGLAHVVNLDAIARGVATEAVLWQWIGGLFTWSRAAELLDLGADEMTAQLELSVAVVERFWRTGRAVFTGPEYQLAKRGVEVMDALAEQVDLATAILAARWGELRVNALQIQKRATR